MRQKEVINIRDGCRFGYVCDIIIDQRDGCIRTLVVPGPGRIFGFFGPLKEYHIGWECIEQISEDLILVSIDPEKVLVDC